MHNIMHTLFSYFAQNWGSLVCWFIITGTLGVVRFYQKKWKKANKIILENQENIQNVSNLSKETIKSLKEQCDNFEELFESANIQLMLNNTKIDKEVLDLIYATTSATASTSQNKGRSQNV